MKSTPKCVRASDRRTCRIAFSVIELIIVIGIVAVLVSLIMPAVQSARETARLTQCLSNLKSIGAAVAQYAEVQSAFPIGRRPELDRRYAGFNPPCTTETVDRSFLVALLPYIEQPALSEMLNDNLSVFGLENVTVHRRTVSMYVCTSDPDVADLKPYTPPPHIFLSNLPPPSGGWHFALGSYSGNFGSFLIAGFPSFHRNCQVPLHALSQANGVFTDVSPLHWKHLVGGASKTIFVSEKSASLLISKNAQGIIYQSWWVSGNLNATLFTGYFPPNAIFTRLGADPLARDTACSSFHPNGVNVLLGDGSARFVDQNIDSWSFSTQSNQPMGISGDAFNGWTSIPTYGVWQRLTDRSSLDKVAEF